MMRKTILSASLAAASLLAGLTACNNDKLTEVNANPNAPEKVQSSSLFTNATVGALSRIRGSSFEHGLSGIWDEHYAEIQYPEADLNQPRNATTEAHWTGFYSGPLQDYKQILTQSVGQPNIIGPTLVMRDFVLETMTDFWGDIPFSEAGQGSANFTPKYDTQQAIYDTLFSSLTSAAAMMSSIPAARIDIEQRFGTADPVFGQGPFEKTATLQTTAWIKLANSLHARAAMRISQVDAAKSKTELLKALAGPTISSNAENAFVPWPGGVLANPLCLNWADAGCGGTRDDQRLSERFVDTLKVTKDPRLAAYAEPTVASLTAKTVCDIPYRGYPNGHSSADVVNPCSAKGAPFGLADYSRPTLSIRSEGSPSFIMTYAELLFIKAEAAQRGWIAADPAALYAAAITASMEQWGVDPADIAAYLAQPNVMYQPAIALKQIAYEKWVALFNEETEAYSEYRRLDYPVLKPGPDAITNTIPTRLPYPDIENSLNAGNLAAAKTSQGNTDITGKVWWDKP
jgi:hypothetical protein